MQVFSLGFICACCVTAVGLASAGPLFRLLGATGAYLDLATGYITPLFLGRQPAPNQAMVLALNAIDSDRARLETLIYEESEGGEVGLAEDMEFFDLTEDTIYSEDSRDWDMSQRQE